MSTPQPAAAPVPAPRATRQLAEPKAKCGEKVSASIAMEVVGRGKALRGARATMWLSKVRAHPRGRCLSGPRALTPLPPRQGCVVVCPPGDAAVVVNGDIPPQAETYAAERDKRRSFVPAHNGKVLRSMRRVPVFWTVNEGCFPNVKMMRTDEDQNMEISWVPEEDIAPGEEVVADYGESYNPLRTKANGYPSEAEEDEPSAKRRRTK